MSHVNSYANIEKRTFRAAFIHLLESEYRMLASRRMLQVLAEDVERLVEEFYPPPERASSGSLIWTCTGDEGQPVLADRPGKAQPGKPTEAYKTVTVVLPLIGPEERVEHTARCGRHQGAQRSREWLKRQIRRW